ncbi:N-acetylglucosamine-6-phosphate deacetylase isoform X2 [Serinus canaria]|uniref:N-acetylglucosamine-6-phosphate deacetylase isoform X2 n=1 Tax=Serinus canaria TaxID=9135 RepID=UPI0021CCF411|nr:N-acetylglucosamine-6-phosphate deacetylase isoform X2 [Serinus canaria]
MPSNKSVSDAPIVQFTNCRILRDHQLQREDLWVREGKILNPEKLFFDEKGSADVQLDCKDSIIAPGFIDVQINGGFGVDFSLATDDFKSGIDLVSQKILSHGVTSFCPTLVTSPPSVYYQVLPQISVRNGGAHGAGILGAHLEGPFISKEKKGAHPEHCLRTFEAGAFQDLLATYGSLDCVQIVTLAPEMRRSSEVIQELTKRGICVSLGHSVANLSQAEEAVQHGATFITHLFNAMLPFHHRDPGIVGLLTSDKIPAGRRVFYGMISDGIHTNPAALRIAHRAHPKGLVLVTDAIAGMGLAPGRHTLGQQVVEIDGLNTYIAGTKTLSGSVATMDTCVRHFQEATGCSVETALEAASLHPAQLLGIEHKKGTLNYDSDAAEETQNIFKVLHSPETPLADKQQVMSNEFGNCDCHLKMNEGQKSMEKGMIPDVVDVQPSKGQAADCVNPTPEAKPELFTSSGSSFQFDFTLSKTYPEADAGDSGAKQVQNNARATRQENWNGPLRFAASGQEPKFAFNFAIPDEDCPHLQLLPASQHKGDTADSSLPAQSATLPQAAALQKPEVTQMTGNAPKEDRNHVTSKIPQRETMPADAAVTEKSTGGGAAQKKKKKKQKASVSKNKTEETETSKKAKAEANNCQNTDTSHQDEKTSQSDEQLWKEVDWCVSQLELGLKTQKPTPKQAEEALRAIRTLRSDKAPLVKKRQLMRSMFGDYRKKMQDELCRELKHMETAAQSARIVELKGSILKKNGQFIRKCLGACRKSQGSAESEAHKTLNTGLFSFTTPQEFHFNFF